MEYRIALDRMEFRALHGCYELERKVGNRFTVDLEAQTLTALSDGRSERFEIDAYKKKCLLNGYDDVDYLLSIADRIEAFEASRR